MSTRQRAQWRHKKKSDRTMLVIITAFAIALGLAAYSIATFSSDKPSDISTAYASEKPNTVLPQPVQAFDFMGMGGATSLPTPSASSSTTAQPTPTASSALPTPQTSTTTPAQAPTRQETSAASPAPREENKQSEEFDWGKWWDELFEEEPTQSPPPPNPQTTASALPRRSSSPSPTATTASPSPSSVSASANVSPSSSPMVS